MEAAVQLRKPHQWHVDADVALIRDLVAVVDQPLDLRQQRVVRLQLRPRGGNQHFSLCSIAIERMPSRERKRPIPAAKELAKQGAKLFLILVPRDHDLAYGPLMGGGEPFVLFLRSRLQRPAPNVALGASPDRPEVRPNVGTTLGAGGARELAFDIGQPDVIRPAAGIQGDAVAARVVTARDDHLARAHLAEFGEGDFVVGHRVLMLLSADRLKPQLEVIVIVR